MSKICGLSLLVFFICLGFCQKGFSEEYYFLVGKWVEINGPENWETLGVGLDERTCDRINSALYFDDKYLFERLCQDYNIFRIKNHSSAMVLDVKLFERKAKVMVFNGLYRRESGWIPIEWLDNNLERPKLTDKRERIITKYITFEL
ncbi:MAG: hypothetical protein JW867_07325 [Candidatus Omnitrophica bacterium]|nr:hypothetical protein [Candidatus Omnitrophota bacterium]